MLLRLFGIRLAASSQNSKQLPYRQRDDFLSAAEFSFFRVLMLAVKGSYHVCPKVNLGDISFLLLAPTRIDRTETRSTASMSISCSAKKGDQKGSEFWGCKNYQKCRKTVRI